jgi:hypothetical protein
LLKFLGIGAQKAGTTWLYYVLREHEKILFPAGKEVHFWDRHLAKGVEWYNALFQGNSDQWMGEITPAYAILPNKIVAKIGHHFPDLRLIYIIRNPIQRAWSSAKMALKRAEMTFEEASDQWFIDHFRSQGSLSRGDYERCIRTWRQYFAAEQLLVIKFDLLKKKPDIFIQKCLVHLGLENAIPETLLPRLFDPVFETEKFVLRESLYSELISIYEEKIRSLEDYLMKDLSSWLEDTSCSAE